MASYTPYLSLDLVERGAVEWHDRVNGNFVTLDSKFAGTSGHTHSGTPGSGPRISHSNLTFELAYLPSNTHAQIDTHIANTSIHPTSANTKVIVSNLQESAATPTADVVDSVYIKQTLNNTLDIRFPRALSVKNPSGNILVVDTGLNGGGTGPAVGVPTHLPTTYAPVVAVDHFTGMTGQRLSAGDWFTVSDSSSPAQFEYGQSEARIYQKSSNRGVMSARVLHRVKSAVPHSEVQRVTLNVAEMVGETPLTDRVSFQLALMASSRIGIAHPCYLGIFLRIELLGTTVKKTIYSISGPPTAGAQTPTIWWTTTGTANSTNYNVRGVHEFSLDRNHRLHYYYNNGPVDISGGTNDPTVSGALTADVQTLIAALLAERSAVHPVGSSATYLPVSPKYGRFGFDAEWAVSTGVKYSFTDFSASSIDDENTYYLCTNVPPAPTSVFPAILPRQNCCSSGTWSTTKVGDFIYLVGGQPSGSVHPADVRTFVVTDLVGPDDPAYPDGSPTIEGGFLYSEVIPGGYSQRYVEFCEAMGGTPLVTQMRLARTNSRASIKIEAQRIPSLLLEPSFAPIGTAVNIAPPIQGKAISATFIPSNTRTYAVPIPYPDYSDPNSTTNTVVWPTTQPLNDQAIKNVEYRRQTDGSLLVDFDVGDLPPGAFLAMNLTDALNGTNTLSVPVAVPILPNKPEITSVRIFTSPYTNQFNETSSMSGGTNYLVITGKNFPLGLLPEGGTLWGGYPLTGTVANFKERGYSLVDADTGASPTFATIEDMTVYKGTYFPLSGTWSGGFSTTGLTRSDSEGVTAFIKINVANSATAKNLVVRLQQVLDVALEPTDVQFAIPAGAANLQYFKVMEGATETTSANANAKTLTVYATEFVTPVTASIVVNPGTATIGSVVVASNPSRATLTVTTPEAGNIVVRLINTGGSYIDVGWVVGATKTRASPQ
jgi:hypothetical protein